MCNGGFKILSVHGFLGFVFLSEACPPFPEALALLLLGASRDKKALGRFGLLIPLGFSFGDVMPCALLRKLAIL